MHPVASTAVNSAVTQQKRQLTNSAGSQVVACGLFFATVGSSNVLRIENLFAGQVSDSAGRFLAKLRILDARLETRNRLFAVADFSIQEAILRVVQARVQPRCREQLVVRSLLPYFTFVNH